MIQTENSRMDNTKSYNQTPISPPPFFHTLKQISRTQASQDDPTAQQRQPNCSRRFESVSITRESQPKTILPPILPQKEKTKKKRNTTHQNPIHKNLIQRMSHSQPNIRPRRLNRIRMIITHNRQRQRDRIKHRRLFVQMIVIVRDGLNVIGDFGFELRIDFAGVDGDVVFSDGVDACDVHPGLH